MSSQIPIPFRIKYMCFMFLVQVIIIISRYQIKTYDYAKLVAKQ